MELDLYQVDAFASRVFTGNPAAVVPLETWLDDATLQSIAGENNLSETAFFVPGGTDGEDYALRWFTPALEVDLCGHATLATAHVLFRHLGRQQDTISFSSRSGTLRVERDGDLLVLDFPAASVTRAEVSPELTAALGATPTEVYVSDYWLAVFDTERDVAALDPDARAVAAIGKGLVIATAPGDEVDFVSRFFAPGAGIDEDPVTGSAHCILTPYWAQRLGKDALTARQISARGGRLDCTRSGDRVRIGGRAVTYLIGKLRIES